MAGFRARNCGRAAAANYLNGAGQHRLRSISGACWPAASSATKQRIGYFWANWQRICGPGCAGGWRDCRDSTERDIAPSAACNHERRPRRVGRAMPRPISSLGAQRSGMSPGPVTSTVFPLTTSRVRERNTFRTSGRAARIDQRLTRVPRCGCNTLSQLTAKWIRCLGLEVGMNLCVCDTS